MEKKLKFKLGGDGRDGGERLRESLLIVVLTSTKKVCTIFVEFLGHFLRHFLGHFLSHFLRHLLAHF